MNKSKNRKLGDNTIKYGFFVRPNVERSMMNVSYIVAGDWRELQGYVCDHLDLIPALDFPEQTAREIFETVVTESAMSFKANGKEFLVQR